LKKKKALRPTPQKGLEIGGKGTCCVRRGFGGKKMERRSDVFGRKKRKGSGRRWEGGSDVFREGGGWKHDKEMVYGKGLQKGPCGGGAKVDKLNNPKQKAGKIERIKENEKKSESGGGERLWLQELNLGVSERGRNEERSEGNQGER